MPEAELVRRLTKIAPLVDGIVVHPDAMDDPRAYRPLGSCLVLENMDAAKRRGARSPLRLLRGAPHTGFRLDIAHVLLVDPSMEAGERLLDAFAGRLRQLHVLLGRRGLPPRPADRRARGALAALLRRCPDVPWILEAPLTLVRRLRGR